MLRVVIIEDEKPARAKLTRYIRQYSQFAEIVKEMDSIESVKEFLGHMPELDLIFSDIELLDGNIFEAFAGLKIPCPIIFTTAYNQFLMDAFANHGIGYLLKPFTYEQFEQAMANYDFLNKNFQSLQYRVLEEVSSLLKRNQNRNALGLLSRVAVKKGESLYFIELEQVVYFKGEGSVIKAIDVKGKSNIICENSLLELQAKLSPSDFFRINRSEIVHKKYIRRIESYTKSSVAVYFQDNQISLVTSQSNTSAFREWLVN